jgi:hypothetical protein
MNSSPNVTEPMSRADFEELIRDAACRGVPYYRAPGFHEWTPLHPCPDCKPEDTGCEANGDCGECGGWGSYDGEHCEHCDGSGNCPTCQGEGEVTE